MRADEQGSSLGSMCMFIEFGRLGCKHIIYLGAGYVHLMHVLTHDILAQALCVCLWPSVMVISTTLLPWPWAPELRGGAFTPCAIWHSQRKESLRACWTGSFGKCIRWLSTSHKLWTFGYRNSCRVEPLHSRVTFKELFNLPPWWEWGNMVQR